MIHKQAILFYSSALDGSPPTPISASAAAASSPDEILLGQHHRSAAGWPPPLTNGRNNGVVCDFLLLALSASGVSFFLTISHTIWSFPVRTHPQNTLHTTLPAHFLMLQPGVLEALGGGGSRLRVVIQHGGQEVGELDGVLEGPLVLFAQDVDEAPRFEAGDVAEFALGVEGVVGHPAGEGDPLGDGA